MNKKISVILILAFILCYSFGCSKKSEEIEYNYELGKYCSEKLKTANYYPQFDKDSMYYYGYSFIENSTLLIVGNYPIKDIIAEAADLFEQKPAFNTWIDGHYLNYDLAEDKITYIKFNLEPSYIYDSEENSLKQADIKYNILKMELYNNEQGAEVLETQLYEILKVNSILYPVLYEFERNITGVNFTRYSIESISQVDSTELSSPYFYDTEFPNPLGTKRDIMQINCGENLENSEFLRIFQVFSGAYNEISDRTYINFSKFAHKDEASCRYYSLYDYGVDSYMPDYIGFGDEFGNFFVTPGFYSNNSYFSKRNLNYKSLSQKNIQKFLKDFRGDSGLEGDLSIISVLNNSILSVAQSIGGDYTAMADYKNTSLTVFSLDDCSYEEFLQGYTNVLGAHLIDNYPFKQDVGAIIDSYFDGNKGYSNFRP
jgi:hypothetical protein